MNTNSFFCGIKPLKDGIMSASELEKAKPSHNERRNATTGFACGIIKYNYLQDEYFEG